jgi:hypothetical protein
MLLNVSHVTQDVKNVKTIQKTVLFVTIPESKILLVAHVMTDILKLMTNVKFVTISVPPVTKMKEIVWFVLLTDILLQLVSVQMELMNSNYKPIVQIVINNVLNVMEWVTTVSLVLKDTLTHQNVQLPQLTLLLLKLSTSLLDPLESLTVLFLVKLVNNMLTNVLFVMPTELTLHHVIVLLVSTLIQPPKNVKDVTTDVPSVMLSPLTLIQNVLLVKKIVLLLVLVFVQMDSMISKDNQNVNHAQLNVLLVTTTENVSLVILTELIQELVHVEMVCMKTKTKYVKYVPHTV